MIKTQQRGFTLIELVVVIVILGILAAFAVPRFMGMEGEARAATVKNLAGTLLASSTMGHAKCLAQGCANAAVLPFENTTITIANAYPNRATIINTIQGSVAGNPGTLPGWAVTNVAAAAPSGPALKFQKVGGTATCWVQYAETLNANTPPVISFGVAGATEQAIAAALSVACQG